METVGRKEERVALRFPERVTLVQARLGTEAKAADQLHGRLQMEATRSHQILTTPPLYCRRWTYTPTQISILEILLTPQPVQRKRSIPIWSYRQEKPAPTRRSHPAHAPKRKHPEKGREVQQFTQTRQNLKNPKKKKMIQIITMSPDKRWG